jgi:hypothetical protein
VGVAPDVNRARAIEHDPPVCEDIDTKPLDRHEIRLELLVAEDSLSGRASDPDGEGRDFIGWLGLIGAIDALVRGDAPVEALGAEPDEAPGVGGPEG